MNAYHYVDLEYDARLESEITEAPVIQTDGERDYSFIDRLFERVKEMQNESNRTKGR
jgi:hypothetical protein